MTPYRVDALETPSLFKTVVAVAVPACDEAATIEACIRALDVAAAKAVGSKVLLIVLVNNSGDDTAKLARGYCPEAVRISVEEVILPPEHAHAGGARRQALEYAARLLPDSGILMTTDADSRVDPNWIVANLAELAAGADAVAGVIAFSSEDRKVLPALPLRVLEWELAGLHARLASLVDPRAHDPWPNHIWAWGASLAVKLSAYRHVGGLPSIPLAEDRALAEALERCDLKLRHSHAALVLTSARRNGRAPGGLADMLQSYVTETAAPCDAALEPTAALLRRLCWRARLRRIATNRGLPTAVKVAGRLGYIGRLPSGFGALWSGVEAQSPLLVRTRVTPAMLAVEVALAERLISRIERRAAGRDDIRASVPAA